ncbi:MAG: heme exporter protein CcmB [Candidatus Rokubacteria bacterium]|nr:heme exporter protein CcmB [Candidatus Rokubacteria bacterium]
MYLRRAWAVFWKDSLVERRSKEMANGLFFFAFLLLFLFHFALGPDRARIEMAFPGLLWLGFLLTGLLGLGRTFLGERENDCLEGLVLAPGDKSAIYLGKVAGGVVLMLLLQVFLLLLFTVFYNLEMRKVLPGLAFVGALGAIGFAAVGSLFAAITAQVRARELLFPLLLLPVVIPLLLGAVAATGELVQSHSLSAARHWLALLAGADLIYLTTGLLTFEFILEA